MGLLDRGRGGRIPDGGEQSVSASAAPVVRRVGNEGASGDADFETSGRGSGDGGLARESDDERVSGKCEPECGANCGMTVIVGGVELVMVMG